jgi:hypothetical protein
LVRAPLAAVGEREGLGQAAALTRIAEIALAVLADADGELPALRGDERAAVVIHLHSAGRAADGAAEPVRSAERQEEAVRRSARIADGPGLPDPVVRRLTCGARVRTVVHGPDQTVIDVGRSRRLVTARQFRALLLRDGGCAHPGCGSRRKLAAHHVRHWVEGGPTDLANVVLLCCAHHHAHHEGEYTITPLGRGRFAFTRADGRDLYPPSDPAGVSAEPGPAGRDYDHVRADAATTRWDGTRMDHRYAIAVLAQRLRAPAAA